MTKEEIKSAVKIIIWMLLACAALSMCNSCSTAKYVPVPSTSVKTEYVYKTDTVYKDRLKTVYKESASRDTVYVTDSTSMTVDAAGNVIRTDRFHNEKRLAVDKTYVTEMDSLVAAVTKAMETASARTDSIAVAYPVEKKQGFLDRAENVFVLVTIFLLVYVSFRVLRLNRN